MQFRAYQRSAVALKPIRVRLLPGTEGTVDRQGGGGGEARAEANAAGGRILARSRRTSSEIEGKRHSVALPLSGFIPW